MLLTHLRRLVEEVLHPGAEVVDEPHGVPEKLKRAYEFVELLDQLCLVVFAH